MIHASEKDSHSQKQTPPDTLLSRKSKASPPPCFVLIRDVIHQMMYVSPTCHAVINSEPFQRLMGVKQLGSASLIFPSATQTRFEHCIGVSHLAMRLVNHLRFAQPELGLEEVHVEAVEMAGLCHDLGHGPFSHTYDMASKRALSGSHIIHEERSKVIARDIMQTLPYPPSLAFVDAVCYMIEPMGRIPSFLEKHAYLAEIVCNQLHGIDVDKLDYLLRDVHYVSMGSVPFKEQIKVHFDIERIIKSAVAVKGRLVFRVTCKNDMKEVSTLRLKMHEYVYGNVDALMCDYIVGSMMAVAIESEHLKYVHTDSDVFKKVQGCESAREIENKCRSYKWVKDVMEKPKRIQSDTIALEWNVYNTRQSPWNALPLIPFIDERGTVQTFHEHSWGLLSWKQKQNKPMWRIYNINTQLK
jgi:HD superfamily phosphohydrolase